jgi:hypothetical protein
MNAPRPPDFLCIGAAKAGTTWLYQMLVQCPGYWMPPVKELRYFGKRHTAERDAHLLAEPHVHITDEERAWMRLYVEREPKDNDWYYSLFEAAGDRITGDVSPNYVSLPLRIVREAKAVAPDARIIMLVRNPVEQKLSHLLLFTTRRILGRRKQTAILDALADRIGLPRELDGRRQALLARYEIPFMVRGDVNLVLDAYNRSASEKIALSDILDQLGRAITVDELRADLGEPFLVNQGRQALAIRTWREVYGDKMKVLFYDDLVDDPEAFLREITNFLGREATPEDPAILRHNVNPGIYNIVGLDELKTELAPFCASELDDLEAVLGPRVAAWR